MKVAISGGHGIGKSTLCSLVMADCLKNNISVGFVNESVKKSYFMFRGERSPKMHLESMLIQAHDELIESEYFGDVLLDRCVIDYLAYSQIRHPESQHEVELSALEAFTRAFVPSYDRVYILFGTETEYQSPHNKLRDAEETSSFAVSSQIQIICEQVGVPYTRVGPLGRDTCVSEIVALFKRS